MRFVFYVAEKDRNWGLAEAVAAGAKVHGDEVVIVPQRDFAGVRADFDGAACLGVKRAGKRLLNAHVQAGQRFLFFDKGYFERASYARVAIDAWQPIAYFRCGRSGHRFERLGVKIGDRRQVRKNAHVIFAGSSQKYCNFHDLGEATAYAQRVINKLRRRTGRPIVYRPKPSWAQNHPEECRPIEGTTFSGPGTPLKDWLSEAHLLVTHGSNAAFDALAYGVPIMVLGTGICRAVALDENYELLENPTWPPEEERRQFFHDAAWCQWTMEEYRSGEAWADIRRTLQRVEAPRGQADLGDVIAQYRTMHENPKYFRGREGLKHFASVGRLCLETGAKTLLDYGSGKGEQYGTPYLLGEAWGVDVTCYDPGYPPFEKKPDGTFDAVVCLDVMEHVPEAHVDDTLRDVISRASKFAFLAISTSPASKTLPDGRNCHLTVRPQSWWDERIAAARVAVGATPERVVAVFSQQREEGKPFADDE